MNNDFREKVKEIFITAIKLAPELRPSYLDEVCFGDADVRREVESLLASHDEAENFMETPAVAEVADVVYSSENSVKAISFRHYEIIEQIGAGGMGEVYLATDTKLERRVAIKILNERFSRHESNLQRFLKEAKAASALNHPNILIIHEINLSDEASYIVSEYIEGRTLREIVESSSLKLAEILDISTQIVSALIAAHTAKIVHRDIKPENIIVRPDGFVKILDFGLAKLVEQENIALESSIVKLNETAEGIILGTVNYMSPEQAKGQKIDTKTDIFSFGIVLFEMLTGQNPFRGETISHTIIAILENEPPPLSSFIGNAPAEIERIVKKCLEKKLPARYESAKDLLADLKALEKRLEFEAALERSAEPDFQTIKITQSIEPGISASNSNLSPNNLKENLEPLIGREKEISEIKDLLRQTTVRLLALTGIGGCGKTRLAQAVAKELLPDFPDGVFFIELAAITGADLVAPAIAQPLGVRESGGKLIFEVLKGYLSDKKMLLVIDNFEQVTDAAPQIGELLNGSNLKILITSRTLLRLSTEREFGVPPLTDDDAVNLFVQRAWKAKNGFVLTGENVRSVAEICKRLEGLPLAIELAAARVKILSPQSILSKLENRLQLLTGGARDLPTRQQTMRGAIAWSYELLGKDEKALLQHLAVFVGSFTFEAAEAVCGNNDLSKIQPDFLDLLTSLVDKSLLVVKEQSETSEMRLRMLEIVREFALESLEEGNQANEICRRHALYFLELAEKAEPHLQSDQAGEWLNLLESEHDNLRAALNWSFHFAPETAARLAASLRLLWNLHGHLTEGRQWLEKALDSKADISLDTKWKILLGVGLITNLQGDFNAGQFFLKKCRETAFSANNRRKVALSDKFLSWTLRVSGNYEAAKILLEESLAVGRELDDKEVMAQSFLSLGELERLKNNFAEACRFYEQSLDFFQQIGKKNATVICLINLGAVTYLRNDFQKSRSYYEKALEISQKLGYKLVLSLCFDGFAALNFKQDELENAVKLSATAEKLRESIGSVLEKEDRRFRDNYLTNLKNKMDDISFSKLYEQGRKLKLEEALSLIENFKP